MISFGQVQLNINERKKKLDVENVFIKHYAPNRKLAS